MKECLLPLLYLGKMILEQRLNLLLRERIANKNRVKQVFQLRLVLIRSEMYLDHLNLM